MPRKRGRKSRVIGTLRAIILLCCSEIRFLAASDDEAEEQEEEDDLEGEFPGSAAAAAQPARMTARQAAIAGGSGPVEHVSLGMRDLPTLAVTHYYQSQRNRPTLASGNGQRRRLRFVVKRRQESASSRAHNDKKTRNK